MRIMVNISIPAISEKYDILVPDDLRIKTVVNLIASTTESLSNGLYVASGEECLCSVEKNILLRHSATLEKYGIKNGDHLIMM